jgi:hypothetical protein
VQAPLSQSLPDAHRLPGTHRLGQLPPQSTSLSAPFCTPSPQVGAWQALAVHTPLAQSAGIEHLAAVLHLMSVSVPFRTPSVHVGTAHVALQTPLLQSVAALHVVPSAHPFEQLPPQSVPVSDPFFTPSVQVGT